MRLFEKTPEAMTGSRIAAVDYAKTLAIVCVVMIHVSSELLLGRQIGSAAWLEGLFWSSLARGAVPLFLMCSGVLFLDRSGGLSVRRIWKRNIPHILLALLVWAAVYKLVPRFLHEKLTAEALRTILLELLCGQHEGHLYFLHIMLLVYAALPVTYTFAANADEKTERYALAFWIVSGVLLPTAKGLGLLHAFSGIFLQWPLTLAWAAIGCTWLGHFLMNRDPLPVHLAAAMLLAGFLICFAGTWLRSVRAGKLSAQLLEGLSPGPCLIAAGVFSLCMRVGKKGYGKLARMAKALSGGSFCVYLAHLLVLRVLAHVGFSTSCFRPAVSVPFLTLLCLLGSYCIRRSAYRFFFIIPITSTYSIPKKTGKSSENEMFFEKSHILCSKAGASFSS